MLKPIKKIVLESTIKQLPTKPIQVNSVIRPPHIRNQHVKDEIAAKNHTDKEQENQHIVVKDSDVIDYTTPNGKKIKLKISQRKTYTNDIEAYNQHHREDALKENSDHFKKTTFGYIKDNPDDMNEMKVNSKFFEDFGINNFIDNLNFGDGALFSLDFLVNARRIGDGRFSFNLKYLKETNPVQIQKDLLRKNNEDKLIEKQAQLHSSIRIDTQDKRLFNNIQYIKAQGPDVKPNTGTELHIDLMRNNKNIAINNNLSNIETLIDAGLTTGPYLWPECGYLVDQYARDGYLYNISKNSDIIYDEQPRDAVEKHKKLMQSDQIKELNNKFTQTGDVDFIKQRIEIEYRDMIELHAEFKTSIDFYKEVLKGMLFGAHFNFSVHDTPLSNTHLSKLNKRSQKVFGKSLNI